MTTTKTYTATEKMIGLVDRMASAQSLFDSVQPISGLEDHYIVRSGQSAYLVSGSCSCPDYRYRFELHGGSCKHVIAVESYRLTARLTDIEARLPSIEARLETVRTALDGVCGRLDQAA